MPKDCAVPICPGSENCPIQKFLAKYSQLNRVMLGHSRRCTIGSTIRSVQAHRQTISEQPSRPRDETDEPEREPLWMRARRLARKHHVG